MSWCHLSYRAVCKAEKETRRKSKAGELLTDQESEFIARYSYPTPYCILVCANLSMRICDCKHPLLSLTHVVVSSDQPGCQQG